jgi:hypothetical protein
MITSTTAIEYLKKLMTIRLSRQKPVIDLFEKTLAKLEYVPIEKLMASTPELDRLIMVLPLPQALKIISLLERRVPALLDYMEITVDARKRQANAIFKLIETFKPSHLEMIRAALESAQME